MPADINMKNARVDEGFGLRGLRVLSKHQEAASSSAVNHEPVPSLPQFTFADSLLKASTSSRWFSAHGGSPAHELTARPVSTTSRVSFSSFLPSLCFDCATMFSILVVVCLVEQYVVTDIGSFDCGWWACWTEIRADCVLLTAILSLLSWKRCWSYPVPFLRGPIE